MKVSLKYVRNPGMLDKERVVFTVNKLTDIGLFGVMTSNISKDGGALSGGRQAFWFPDKEVKPGDIVVLYSKRGTLSTKENSDGTTSHFFYWNLAIPIWKAAQNGVVLFETRSWEFMAVDHIHEEQE